MNLVQRMVAENRQSVTSQELAEATELPHEKVAQTIKEEYSENLNLGSIQMQGEYFILDKDQAFNIITSLPVTKETPPTRSDILIRELMNSIVDVLMAFAKGFEERTGRYLNLIQEYCNQTGINILEMEKDKTNER